MKAQNPYDSSKELELYRVVNKLLLNASFDSRITHEELRLLVYLSCAFIDEEQRNIELSQNKLKMILDLDMLELSEAIEGLENNGYLVKLKHSDTGLNTYGLSMPYGDMVEPQGRLIN
ncbi:hypothetical protein WDW89_17820 [Deltaproteobacteria bacterium TL4]